MHIKDYLAENKGAATKLAEHLGIRPSQLSQKISGYRPIQPIEAARIERFTNGLVTRQEMFPNDWADIWPELATQQPTEQGGLNANAARLLHRHAGALRVASVSGSAPDRHCVVD